MSRAGGSILVNTEKFSGIGSISANGGAGVYCSSAYSPGGGSGGRIAVYFQESTFSGSWKAFGSAGHEVGYFGGPGISLLSFMQSLD